MNTSTSIPDPFNSQSSSQSSDNFPEDNFNKTSLVQKIFSGNNFKIIILFFMFLGFLFLWQQVSNQFLLLVITILPMFVGYGLSYLLEPINNFFQKFFSARISQFLVFLIFLLLTLGLVFGLFFIFFFQLNDLYSKLIYQKGPQEFQLFLKTIKDTDDFEVSELKLQSIDSEQFSFEYTKTNNIDNERFLTQNT